MTRYNGRSTLAKTMKQTITQKAAEMGIPFLAEIREGVPIREAISLQQSIFDYAPKAKPTADYAELFNKLMEG